METTLSLPDIGDFTDVLIVEVHVKAGDTIAVDDPLITVESDKAAMDVPSTTAGVVKELKISAGDRISEGGSIALIETGDEHAGEPVTQPASWATEPLAAPGPAPQEPAPVPAPAATPAAPQPVPAAGVHAGPAARRLAHELGVDLATMTGTGKGGRIVREDVLGAFTPTAPATGGGIAPVPIPDFTKFGPIETVDLPRIKQISGPVLLRSWLNVPHVTHNDDADITDLDTYRKDLDTAARAEGYRVTLLAFLMKAAVSALRAFPEVNSSLTQDGKQLTLKRYYNIGVAVDAPGGLVVPVIRDVPAKGVLELSRELGDLSANARDGKLTPAQMQGATFTISSLGGIGGTSFTPIVNAPEVAILGVVRSAIKPVWDGQQFQPRLMLPLSLSYDHRVIDGALAARFTRHLAHTVEDVRRLVL